MAEKRACEECARLQAELEKAMDSGAWGWMLRASLIEGQRKLLADALQEAVGVFELIQEAAHADDFQYVEGWAASAKKAALSASNGGREDVPTG